MTNIDGYFESRVECMRGIRALVVVGLLSFTGCSSDEPTTYEPVELRSSFTVYGMRGKCQEGCKIEPKVDLGGENFAWADLHGANLAGADLGGAILVGTNLKGANLAGANLGAAYLSEAKLRSADLSGANLRGADLREADLANADLTNANLTNADLTDADLTDAILTEGWRDMVKAY